MTETEEHFTIRTPIIPMNTPWNAQVYEPAEDSFLLLDALQLDIGRRLSELDQFEPVLCLEIGPGSGVISAGLMSTKYFGEHIPLIFTLDINPNACLLTQKTSETNNCQARVECIRGNGLEAYLTFRNRFDFIIWNPPYVPTPPSELESSEENAWLRESWDGGQDGNKLILPFMSMIPKLLHATGCVYMVLSSWNQPEELMESVLPPLGLQGHPVLRRAAGRERLSVWRIEYVKEQKP